MKTSTKENLGIVALGVGSAVVVSAMGIVAAVYNISDFDKWFGVAWWTVFIFGFLAYGLWDYLKAPRCLAVFLLALGAGAEAVSVSAISEAECSNNDAVEEPQQHGGKRPWPSWAF